MSIHGMEVNHDAKCPYYKCENKCVIHCEGVQAHQSIHMAFDTKAARRDYEKQFCMARWGTCMVADAHNRKWDYEV